ncbi:hypothetical protein LXL04_038772 [Taraxacum kok-saghyz]
MDLRGKPKSGKTTGGRSREPIHYILGITEIGERLQKREKLNGGNVLVWVLTKTIDQIIYLYITDLVSLAWAILPCIENGIPAPETNKDCVAPVEKVDYSSYTQRQNSHGRGLAIGFCQRRQQMKADEGCGTKRWEVVKVVGVANDIGPMLKKDCNLQICVQCIYEVDGTHSQYDSNLKELVPGLLLYPDFLI